MICTAWIGGQCKWEEEEKAGVEDKQLGYSAGVPFERGPIHTIQVVI